MLRFCHETGIGVIPWSPLFAGRLARPVGWDGSLRSKKPSGHHPGMTPEDEQIIGRVQQIAQKRGWKMCHVALAWHKNKGTIPIVGLNSAERDKILTEEEVKYLEEPYIPRRVVGHS